MYIDTAVLSHQINTTMHNGFIHVLLLTILIDILTGILKGIKTKKLSSRVGTTGLMRHLVIVIMVLFADVYLPLFNFNGISNGFICFFIFNYWTSIIENWTELGLPFPEWGKNILARVNNTQNEKMENTINKYNFKEEK